MFSGGLVVYLNIYFARNILEFALTKIIKI